jgi:pimeloyl-ACP methyl ester carboxylesterase
MSDTLEDGMRYTPFLALFALVLSCGEAVEEPPTPAQFTSGPAEVAAPDGVSIAHTVSGSGSPSLVFIHGWMCDQTFWSAQVEEFRRSNTVVTIDLAGQGLSGMDREGWPLMALGGDVQAVVEELDLADVIVIGHSMGGPVALEAARLMPDRVIGVIGVDSLHDADVKYDPDQMEEIFAAYEHDFVGTCTQFVTSMFREGTDPALADRIITEMCDTPPEISIALLRQFVEYELGPALAAVDVPVRYINASGYPTNVEVNRSYQPDFNGIIMKDVGHFLMMEKPEEFNVLLRETIERLVRPVE